MYTFFTYLSSPQGFVGTQKSFLVLNPCMVPVLNLQTFSFQRMWEFSPMGLMETSSTEPVGGNVGEFWCRCRTIFHENFHHGSSFGKSQDPWCRDSTVTGHSQKIGPQEVLRFRIQLPLGAELLQGLFHGAKVQTSHTWLLCVLVVTSAWCFLLRTSCDQEKAIYLKWEKMRGGGGDLTQWIGGCCALLGSLEDKIRTSSEGRFNWQLETCVDRNVPLRK